MRIVALYRNQTTVRSMLEQWILEAIKSGVDLNQDIRSSVFIIRPTWPTLAEIYALPMWMQCEEIELKDGRLTSIRTVVIDVECQPVSLKPKILPSNKR